MNTKHNNLSIQYFSEISQNDTLDLQGNKGPLHLNLQLLKYRIHF
jgi:hypothetical protein